MMAEQVRTFTIGDRVRFTGTNGNPFELETAREVLLVGAIHTINGVVVADWFTDLVLCDVPGQRFNSVMFEKMPGSSGSQVAS